MFFEHLRTQIASILHATSPAPNQTTAEHPSRSSLCGTLLTLGLIVAFAPAWAADAPLSPMDSDSVFATGPDPGTTLEDRVEVQWTTADSVAVTSSFRITRGGELIHTAASTESIFEDWSAVPGNTYDYCAYVRKTDGSQQLIGCDEGKRVIAPPTGFEASDGLFESYVALHWSDRSEIEGGFNIYRDAGNALHLNGTDDFVSTEGILDLDGSFTFEFWARRAMIGTEDFVINLEVNPNGDPVDVDMEIGFLDDDQFAVAFGTDILAVPVVGDPWGWHHWAVVYDAPTRRRIIYQNDSLLVHDVAATDNQPTGDLEFGRRTKQGPSKNRGHFDGQIDEIRYWDVALTEEEVITRMTDLLSGAETGLVGYWPMDVDVGDMVPDVVGDHSGTLLNGDPAPWVTSGIPEFRTEVEADVTSYLDRAAIIGFQTYDYRVAAYEDVNGDGEFTPGIDFESQDDTDDGWRAFLTPPADVSATDGQYNDRVRITWIDQSSAEDGYRVYRNGSDIGSAPADSTSFEDFSGADETVYDYCVATFSNGVESIHICDAGNAGVLPAPTDVSATDGAYDDMILVEWTDTSDTEDGFEVYRDGNIIATLDENAEVYNDLGVKQLQPHNYCVRAFSQADPLYPAYSDSICTASPGMRAAILDPADLVATLDDFEDRVEMSWKNPSTTVMLFNVYREGTLIEVLDFNMTATTDWEIPSDSLIEYCVRGGTVVSSVSKTMRGQVAQVLQTIRMENAVSLSTGGVIVSPNAMLATAFETMGLEVLSKNGSIAADGFIESNAACGDGSRSLKPPNTVVASDDEFENHVEVTWRDSSDVERGYVVFRGLVDSTAIPIDTVSADRTTYGDYKGTPGVQFDYWIAAYDDYGISAREGNVGKRTLEPPSNLEASDGVDEMIIRLTWDDNSAAEHGYQIFRALEPGPDSLIGETGKSEPAYTDSVADNLRGRTLRYTVVAFDAYGVSEPVPDEGFTRLNAPISLNASDTYGANVVVVWQDESQVESGYELTRYDRTSAVTTALASLPADSTLYNDTSAESGHEYIYCVRARLDAGGETIYSEESCDDGAILVAINGDPGTGEGGPIRFGGASGLFVSAEKLGTSVALGDGVGLIGAPGYDSNGAAKLYEFDEDNHWQHLQTLTPSSRTKAGTAVDISPDYAVIGDPGRFSTWREGSDYVQRANEGYSPNGGVAVATVDSIVAVGNDKLDGHGGVKVCDAESATTCAQLDQLISLSSNDEFGASVDLTLDGDSVYAIVGAPGAKKAYIFECSIAATSCTANSHWELAETLPNAFSTVGGSEFGASVAVSQKYAVVGDPGANGIVVWERNGKLAWDQRKHFRTTDEDVQDFGSVVAMDSTRILIGAPGEEIKDYPGAGAAYVIEWSGGELLEVAKYDARTGGKITENANFGSSVDIGSRLYLIGAPHEPILEALNAFGWKDDAGAFYAIPYGTPPSDDDTTPPGVDILPPGDLEASDGTAPDRIQIRWSDESEDEDGHLIYRNKEGGLFEELAEVSADIEFYDDFSASPGDAYEYCVTAYASGEKEAVETEPVCDIGWRPPNGAISGLVATARGGGTADADICLTPSPNKALLLDGLGGAVQVPYGEALALDYDFTIEAWIRPQDVAGEHYIVAQDSGFAFWIENDLLRFSALESGLLQTYDVTADVPSGEWSHVAVTRDAFNVMTFFLGGEQVGDTVDVNVPVEHGEADTLSIGQKGDGTGFFEGEIDEIRIWHPALPDSLVGNTRRDALTGEEEGLVAYWPLDEGSRRVVPDITESASHGRLLGGAYIADVGAPLETCAKTGREGNYSLTGIRYGTGTEFTVTPTKESREFEPSFRLISLSTESPVQNKVEFVDATAFTVSGVVRYEEVVGDSTWQCPVPEVAIYASETEVAIDGDQKGSTGADGSYAIAVDPSKDEADTWFIIPRLNDETAAEVTHSFTPADSELFVSEDMFDIDFKDEARHTLFGNFSGGDPVLCGKDIGEARVRIWTPDGCYDRTFTVRSDSLNGAFSLVLPPLNYLVEVIEVTEAPDERQEEISEFFKNLGEIEVDMTEGDVERNLTYRAPLVVTVEDLPEASCSAGIEQLDEDENPLRVLPNVPIIGEYEFVELTIGVKEDYGTDEHGDPEYCPVDEGTVEIFDAIADRVDVDSTMQLENGEVKYTTVGMSPNIFSGARIGGVDRSFQKPITFVAHVEGRQPLMVTEWALVEGFRERGSTFVSAITEEFPLLILHDPPGSTSYAFIEEGTTTCNQFSLTGRIRGALGFETQFRFGFHETFIKGTPFASTGTDLQGGGHVGLRFVVGGEVEWGYGPKVNREICVTAEKGFTTSADPGWVGEDIHVGTALNLIFAIADVIETESCTVKLSETLAADINEADPFETTYAYGVSHIEETLIPELEHLIELAGGDATIEGDLDGEETTLRLTSALGNWKQQLKDSEKKAEAALKEPDINRSFSGGTEFTFSENQVTNETHNDLTIRAFLESELQIGGFWAVGAESYIYGLFDLEVETTFHWERTEETSKKIGYVLADEDAGDYFSVDVARRPDYRTYVFNTLSGRSSNPWEDNTQRRDNPIIHVDPPVLYNVQTEWANFELTLINGSESFERRHYTMAVPGETNPHNLGITVTGDLLGGARLESFLLDPGKALTINMDVSNPGGSWYAFKNVGVVLYPEEEYQLWLGDTRLPFALADTAFFDVYFDSTGGNMLTSAMNEGWNWFSINRAGGDVQSIMNNIPLLHGDLIKGEAGDSRYDSTAGWIGPLSELVPGKAYRARLQQPGFLRIKGDPVTATEPMKLKSGWNWIGYLPSKPMPIADALAPLNDRLLEGDAIVGQHGFAQYVNGAGWVGTLTDMVPGEGYQLYLAGGGELLYPEAPEESAPRPPTVRETTTRGPEWDVEAEDYDASMIMVGEVVRSGRPLDHTTIKVAVTAGDTVRGLGDVRFVKELDQYLAFVMIYGTLDEKTDLRVHVYEGDTDALFEDIGTIHYAAQTMLGQAASPVRLELNNAGLALELVDVPEEFALYPNYPNPFNPITVIGYDLPEQSMVTMTLYDVMGRRVARLVDEERTAGRHKVIFDGRTYASGLYLYRIKAGDFTQVGKMMLVK